MKHKRIRVCKICRTSIVASHGRAMYCDRCKPHAHRHRSNLRRRRNKQTVAFFTPVSKACKGCKKLWPIKEYRVKERINDKGYRCINRGNLCKECYRKSRRDEHREIRGFPVRWIKECLLCKQVFLTNRLYFQKYCSVKCQIKAEIARRPKKPSQAKIKQAQMFKSCARCGSFGEKYTSGKRPNGEQRYSSYCKECDKQERREYSERWKAEEPAAYQRQLDRLKQWKLDNPEKARNGGNKRKEKGMYVKDWRIILEIFNNSCAYCDATDVPLEKDHVIPYSEGGKLTVDNVVPACPDCNQHSIEGKGTKDMRTWLQDEQRYEAVMMSIGDASYIAREEM